MQTTKKHDGVLDAAVCPLNMQPSHCLEHAPKRAEKKEVARLRSVSPPSPAQLGTANGASHRWLSQHQCREQEG